MPPLTSRTRSTPTANRVKQLTKVFHLFASFPTRKTAPRLPPAKTEGSGDLSSSNKEVGMAGTVSIVARPCVADHILGAYRPAVGRSPSVSGSSVARGNEDHFSTANGHAYNRMDAFLQANIRWNHQRSRLPARALFFTRPIKERRVALNGAGGTSHQYMAAGLGRRHGGLRRALIGDV